MTRIAIIIGSTRTHRRGHAVATWAHQHAQEHSPEDVDFDLVDLADFALPVLDEPAPAAWGIYAHEHTRRWAETIRAYDGYVFVLTEYNHGVPGPLKNALDYLYDEWSDKSVGFVSYGLHGGIRAVEQMRTIAAEFKLADVRDQVSLSIYEDFDFEGLDMGDPTVTGRLAPRDFHLDDLSATLHGVVVWAEAMASLRVPVPA